MSALRTQLVTQIVMHLKIQMSLKYLANVTFKRGFIGLADGGVRHQIKTLECRHFEQGKYNNSNNTIRQEMLF